MSKELKSRTEMDKKYQWRLEDIFASDEAYEQAYAQAERAIENMAGWQGRVRTNPRQAILDADALSLRMDRLAAYAAERDEECVRVRQEMTRTLDALNEESLRAERGGAEIEAKLQNLNDRLVELVMERRRG